MSALDSQQTDRIGVKLVDLQIERGGWIFREQAIADYGIDAQIESKKEGTGTGRLIALQIKSGASFFSDETENGFIFRGKARHLDYWLNHSLPVILLLVNIETEEIYWVEVTEAKVEFTGKGWKIEVPKSNLLKTEDLRDFESIATYRRHFPQPMIDEMIGGEIESLRKMRLYAEYDREGAAKSFGSNLLTGHFSGGSAEKKASALAWCARILSPPDTIALAKQFLRQSLGLATTELASIGQAYITSHEGNQTVALEALEVVDSPEARTASLMILSHESEHARALKWLDASGYAPSDFDSDGRFFALHLALAANDWDRAILLQESFSEEDLETTPILLFNLALTKLLEASPVELRHTVAGGVPLFAAEFPFIAGPEADEAIEEALMLFDRSAMVSNSLGLLASQQMAEEFSLWLRLRRPETIDDARNDIKERLRNAKSALSVIPLAIESGVDLELDAVEQILDVNNAPEILADGHVAKARLALALARDNPTESEAYIERHYSDLRKYFQPFYIRSLQSELWAKSGSVERAEEFLELALGEGLPSIEESRLRRMLSEARGSDPVSERKSQFEDSNQLADLASLVEALYQTENWYELAKYGETLFSRTSSLKDAERLVNALLMSHQSRKILELFEERVDLRSQSAALQLGFCWSLFREGELLKARAELDKSSMDSGDPNFRTLQLNLIIGLGDWASIPSLVASEFEARDQRTAIELLNAAQLGLRTGSPHVRALVEAAVEKSEDDAEVLASAYFLASSAGWEDDAEVTVWLHRASELSGERGPLQRVTLNDLVDREPAWRERESEIWKALGNATTPLYLVAQQLNRSLIDFTSFPFLRNLETTDPRRRAVISAFAGNRKRQKIRQSSSVGFEPTALLTFAALDLLDQSLGAFEDVVIPHSTLSWLFEEKQKVAFHQPSRIAMARRIVELIPRKSLEVVQASTLPSSELAFDVGEELALLLAEASNPDLLGERQKVVVRPGPVHLVGSLMNEEANLQNWEHLICSCSAIVEKMLEIGHITSEVANKALSYLNIQERPWPNAPELARDAVLFLDGLAVEYFSHVGLLGELASAGFRVFISPNELAEADELLSYHDLASKVDAMIESIRGCVCEGIKSGKITVDRQASGEKVDASGLYGHPSIDVLGMAPRCDLIVSDDRFLNKYGNVQRKEGLTPVLTSYDIIKHLTRRSVISQDQSRESLTRIRRGGYLFVPLEEKEIMDLLKRASVNEEVILETAELRAVRENLHRARMSGWLQIPNEEHWLSSVMASLRKVLGRIWQDSSAKPNEMRARSDWVVELLDLRGWISGRADGDGGSPVPARALHISALLGFDRDVGDKRRDEYWEWLQSRFLEPIKELEPEVFEEITARVKKQLADVAVAGVRQFDFETEDEA